MRGPRRVWFVVPVVLFLLGVGLIIERCVAVYDRVAGMQRVEVPGEAELLLSAGEHVIYVEGRRDGDAIDLRCGLRGPDGEPIALETPTGSTTYSMFGYHGESAFELTAPRDGVYPLQCEGDRSVMLAIGGRMFGLVVTLVVAIFASLIVPGLALAILVNRRWKARRAAQAAAVGKM